MLIEIYDKVRHVGIPFHSCNDRKYSHFTRNICNRYVDSFKAVSVFNSFAIH